jgi:hypothetical protein
MLESLARAQPRGVRTGFEGWPGFVVDEDAASMWWLGTSYATTSVLFLVYRSDWVRRAAYSATDASSSMSAR